MGYDHFALISLQEDVSEKLIDIIDTAIKSIETDEILFGNVHHLTSAGFNVYWWKRFDDFILKLYMKTNINLYLYVCDEETLSKYKYVKGLREEKVDKGKDILLRINDDDVNMSWNIRSLRITYNITSLYNEDYVWDVYE